MGSDLIGQVAWTLATLSLFFGCRAVYQRLRLPVLHPVLVTTGLLIGATATAGRSPVQFAHDTASVAWLLGPAVTAMAVPVWQQRALILANAAMIGGVILCSLTMALATTTVLRPLLGNPMALALSVKSVTAPVAIGIARTVGLRQDLVVVGVMTSGLLGLTFGPSLLRLVGVSGDRPEMGVALAAVSHGLGTSRAFEVGPTAGSFASVTMGLAALAYGMLLPLVLVDKI